MAPRWLDADEQRAWRAYLDGTLRVLDAVESQLQRDSGQSHGEYEIFVRLSEAPGRRLRMSELADRTSFSRSRLSHAVGRLERAGLLRREPCDDDRRGWHAVLTEAGYRQLERAAPGHVEAVRQAVFDRLGPRDVTALRRIFERIGEP